MLTRIALLSCIALGLGACASPPFSAETSSPHVDRADARQPESKLQQLEIHNGSQRVTVEDVARASESVHTIVDELDGRIDSAQSGNEDRAHFVLRIPSARLTEGLDRIGALGEENFRQIDTEDVTERFADTQARRGNLAALRDRLRALLERAKTVEEILKVERELTRVQTELDTLDGKLARLRNDIDRSRVDLTLERRSTQEILGPLGWLAKGTWWFVKKLFVLRDAS